MFLLWLSGMISVNFGIEDYIIVEYEFKIVLGKINLFIHLIFIIVSYVALLNLKIAFCFGRSLFEYSINAWEA